MQTVLIDTTKTKLTPLEEFIKDNESHMRTQLKNLIADFKKRIKIDKSLYMDSEHLEPSVDIRLCIDAYQTNSNPFILHSPLTTCFKWQFNVGSADYDTRHTTYCGASCITLDSNVDGLLVEMVDQIFESEVNEA